MAVTISFFDPDKNLHISNYYWDKYIKDLGSITMYYMILKARHSPYKTRAEIRRAAGISRATEWRWRKLLVAKGYLPHDR